MWRLWSDTLHDACLGDMYGGPGLPKRQNPPLSASLVGSKGVQSTTFGTSLAAGAGGRFQELTYDRFRGSTPDFLSGFTPIAFVSLETPTRQTDCQPRPMSPVCPIPSYTAEYPVVPAANLVRKQGDHLKVLPQEQLSRSGHMHALAASCRYSSDHYPLDRIGCLLHFTILS